MISLDEDSTGSFHRQKDLCCKDSNNYFILLFGITENKLYLCRWIEVKLFPQHIIKEALCLSCDFENVGNFQKNVQGWHSDFHVLRGLLSLHLYIRVSYDLQNQDVALQFHASLFVLQCSYGN